LTEQLTGYYIALLCGLGYSFLDKGPYQGRVLSEVVDKQPDYFRIACNLMAFMFLCDECTDKVDSNGTRAYAEIVMDALRNPHTERPQGETKLGEVARQ